MRSRLLSRARTFLASLLIVAVSLVVVLVAAEFLLRAFLPQNLEPHLGVYMADSVLDYRLRPDSRFHLKLAEYEMRTSINSQGFRGKEVVKGQGRKIAIIGDSFTFGYGVNDDETFCSLLDGFFDGNTGAKIDVMNFGVGGYDIRRYAPFYYRVVREWEPDLVVLAVYVGNDITDEALGNVRVYGGRLWRGTPTLKNRIRGFLKTNSHLYAFLRDRLAPLAARLNPSQGNTLAYAEGGHFGVNSRHFKAFKESILDMLADARSRDIGFAVVLIPTKEQVYPELQSKMIRLLGQSGIDYDFDAPQDSIERFLAAHSVEFLDLTRTLKEMGTKEKHLYYLRDAHWTPLGHAVAAQALYPFLFKLLEN